MGIIISSRKSTSIGSANVPGGNFSLINAAGAAGRGEQQAGKEIISLGQEVAKLGKILGTTYDSEQSLINYNEAKSMWNFTATSIQEAATNGGTGELDENGDFDPKNIWIPTEYKKNMVTAFGALEGDDRFKKLIASLNAKDFSQFQAWASGEYGTLSGKVNTLGYKRRAVIQKTERKIAINNLFRTSLVPDPEKSLKGYISYDNYLNERSAYGKALSADEIRKNERDFVKFYTLNGLFNNKDPKIPAGATVENYDTAILALSNKEFETDIYIDDDTTLIGLTLKERNVAIKELQDLRKRRIDIDKRLVEESIEKTFDTLKASFEDSTFTSESVRQAVLDNPDFAGTPGHKFWKTEHQRLYGSGVEPKENTKKYYEVDQAIMGGEAIPDLAQKFMTDPRGTIRMVQEYFIKNVPNLSKSSYDNIDSILKDWFSKESNLGNMVTSLDKKVKARLIYKMYTESQGKPVSVDDFKKADMPSIVVNIGLMTTEARAALQSQIDEGMVEWIRNSRARLKIEATNTKLPYLKLLDAPAIGRDDKIISGTENPDYVGEKMMNTFLSGKEYVYSKPPVQLTTYQFDGGKIIDVMNNIASSTSSGKGKYTIDSLPLGDKITIELNDGNFNFYIPSSMSEEDGRIMFWNDVAREKYGDEKKLIIFEDSKDAPKGWTNGREPVPHIVKRLGK